MTHCLQFFVIFVVLLYYPTIEEFQGSLAKRDSPLFYHLFCVLSGFNDSGLVGYRQERDLILIYVFD